jgi:hypothetical protein
MSYEAVYDPLNSTVPNIVTAWNQVDVPTKNPNTLNNPDTKQVNGVVVPFTCTADVLNKAIVPFTAQQTSAWAAQVLFVQQTATFNAALAEVTNKDVMALFVRAAVFMVITRLNELITKYNNDLSARSLPTFTPGPIGSIPASPLTQAAEESDITATLQSLFTVVKGA